MFIFKRKKLLEINEKIEKMLQIMEDQTYIFQNLENRLTILEQTAQMNADGIQQALETVKDSNKDSRQYVCNYLSEKLEQVSSDNVKEFRSLKNMFDFQKRNMDSLGESIVGEIHKLQNRYEDHEKEMQESVNSIKEYVNENIRTGNQDIKDRINILEQTAQMNADGIQQALETVKNSNKDNRQYVCNYLNEKLLQMSSNNEKELECLKNMFDIQKRDMDSLGESIVGEMHKFQNRYGDHEKEMQESLNSINELANMNAETGNSMDEKLDVVEDEIRLLLINSVLEQMPE